MGRRRPTITPLQQIIQYFMTASITEMTQAIEVAQAIVNQRASGGGGTLPSLAPRRPRLVPGVPAMLQGDLTEHGAVPAPATPPVAPRTRAPRTAAAKPRRRRSTPGGPTAAANGPVRRRGPARKEVDVPLPLAGPEPPPLPEQFVPEEE